jgi:septal ring factor EnvC (AmiA/AmiB activator)
VLEQRRRARDRLTAVTAAVQTEGLDPSPLEAIRADVSAWRFDDALSALDDAEADLALYTSQLKDQLASLRKAIKSADLAFPRAIDEAVTAWEFSDLERTLDDAEAALAQLAEQRHEVGPAELRPQRQDP